MASASPADPAAATEIPLGAVDPAAAVALAVAQRSRPPEPVFETRRAVPPEDLDPKYRVAPNASLLALGLSLVGFLDVAYQLYAFKFLGDTTYIHGLPARVLFVFAMTLVVSPLILAIFRRTQLLFVLPAVVLVFFLYPIFLPYGVPAGQDAIFNFQYAYGILEAGRWVPGGNVTLQAVTYSYYPASGVFNAELSAFTGLPLVQTFVWGIPLLRLLIVPPAIYALASRYLGSRVAMVSVLIFLATPSILFNYPVQSEFTIPFFALTLVMLGYVVVRGADWQTEALAAAVMFAGFVVISHNLTSYILAAWVVGLAFCWFVFRTFRGVESRKSLGIFAVYFVVILGFTYEVSLPNFLANVASLRFVLAELSHPFALSVSTATTVGSSFPEYQTAWSYLAYLLLIVLGLIALRRWLRSERRPFLSPNLIVSLIAGILVIPLLVTAFSFLPERILEYGEFFIAPAVAWWLIQHLMPRARPKSRGPTPPRARLSPAMRHRYAAGAGVLILVVLIFTGGSLVPYSTRDQFAPANAITVESPLNIDANSYELGLWAQTHLTSSTYVWGDTLTMCVFGGFARFNMQFDQYMLFAGTSISPLAWEFVSVGSYVVLDKYMTTTTPQFSGPSSDQPTAPLTEAQLAKFNNPALFDLVYEDSTFTIYEVIVVP